MFEDFLVDSYQNAAKRLEGFLYLQKVRHATEKIARIVNRISPLAEFGKIRFIKGHSDQELLIEQLIYIMDENVNDDGPDALEGALALVQGGVGEIEYQSTGVQRATTGGAMGRFLRG